MTNGVFEGMWEEIMQHGAELSGRRVRVTLLDDTEKPGPPNQAMLSLMQDLQNSSRRMTSSEDTAELLRAARSGAMYGNQSDE